MSRITYTHLSSSRFFICRIWHHNRFCCSWRELVIQQTLLLVPASSYQQPIWLPRLHRAGPSASLDKSVVAVLIFAREAPSVPPIAIPSRPCAIWLWRGLYQGTGSLSSRQLLHSQCTSAAQRFSRKWYTSRAQPLVDRKPQSGEDRT